MRVFVLSAMLLASACAGDLVGSETSAIDLDTAWTSHVIVAGNAAAAPYHKGADGVFLSDVNEDGLPDIVSSWEQSNNVTISYHPGYANVWGAWSTTTLSGAGMQGPEDARMADIDADGNLDLVIAASGSNRINVYFGPAWTTKIYVTASLSTKWMQLDFADIDGNGSLDIVAGGKEASTLAATVAWFSSATPRVNASWTKHAIAPVGWTMSTVARDLDDDGDVDVFISDRERIDLPVVDNTKMGERWFESSGGSSPTWTEHQIVNENEHKFSELVDFDGDGTTDIVGGRSSTTFNESYIRLNTGTWGNFDTLAVAQPSGVGQYQDGLSVTDVDLDGVPDLGYTYNAADGDLSGASWARNTGTAADPTWEWGEVSGPAGIKYDNLLWTDLDNDGDLDMLTSEQNEDTDGNSTVGPGLGVVVYENSAI